MTELEKADAGPVQPLAGTTPGGLPYPSPTDPIAQGADAIRNLATAVEAKAMMQWTTYVPTWSGDSGTPNLGTGGALGGLYRQTGAKAFEFAVRLYVGTGNVPPSGSWRWQLPAPASAVLPFPVNGVVELPGTGRYPLAGWVSGGINANQAISFVDARGNALIGGYTLPAGSWIVFAGMYQGA